MVAAAGSSLLPTSQAAYISFSQCSINSFKSKLLNPNRRWVYFLLKIKIICSLLDYRNVSTNAQCLLNSPNSPIPNFRIFAPSENIYNKLPGLVYNVSMQCKMVYGPTSIYCNGVFIWNF
jgi:hypothetical protein